MRVYELARELGVESDVLLKRAQELGVALKNRLSGVDTKDADALRKTFGAAAPAQKPPAEKPKAAGAAPRSKPAAAAPKKSAPSAPAQVPPEQKVTKPVPPKAEVNLPVRNATEEERERARRKQERKGRDRVAVDDEDAAANPVLGRFVPPSSIQRFRRRPMRRTKPKNLRRTTPAAPQKTDGIDLVVPISLKDFSAALGIKTNMIILKLMQAGQMATINAILDGEQAQLLAGEFGFKLNLRQAETAEQAAEAIEISEDRPEDLLPRPPVVTFLGHVDHGKTSLLDRIRKTDVAAHEHGGITQHIGAYRVTSGDKTVVFLDTPGHEAFTAMRSRGANVTDIAVLVVAADDSVMPQTEEAIDHARAAGVPIVVAVNKCDKPEANPTRVRQDLSKHGLQPEEWGGDTVTVDVSAVTGNGVDELLEMLALVAELRELKANPNKPARGTVLEAQVSGSRGPVATVLIQDGTLKVGDVIVCGQSFGRVKALYDDKGRTVTAAKPSWPVAVVGLGSLPEAGDRLLVIDDIQKARAIAESRQRKAREAAVAKREHVNLENLYASIEAGQVQELRLVLKGDVRGTMEALSKVIGDIVSREIKLHILRASVGGITVSDVLLADASDAIIVGMNVVPDTAARSLAEQKGVAIHTYTVIYRVREEIEKALVGMLAPEEREVVVGHAEVRRIFRISRIGSVAGCYVRDGVIVRNNRVRLIRDGTVIHTGRLASLKREKDDAREVREGYECGMHLEGYDDVKAGDIIESFQVEKIARTLDSPASAGG